MSSALPLTPTASGVTGAAPTWDLAGRGVRGRGAWIGDVRRHPRLLVGGALVALLLLAAFLAPVVAPYDPIKVDMGQSLLPPSGAHLLGTDDLGRDVFSRV